MPSTSDLIRWVRGKPRVLAVGRSSERHRRQGSCDARMADQQRCAAPGHRYRQEALRPYRRPIDQHHAAAGGRGGDGINAGGIATTNGNPTVTITANGAHGAIVGDTVYISSAGSPCGWAADQRTNSSLGTNALRTIAGSSLIRVTHAAHSLPENSLISITGSTDFNGIDGSDLGNVRSRVHVLDANSYQFDCGMVATATGSGGGGSLIAQPAKAYVIAAVPTTTSSVSTLGQMQTRRPRVAAVARGSFRADDRAH